MTALCTKCRTQNRAEAIHCAGCGCVLNACPHCTAENRAGAKFCFRCGNALGIRCANCGATNRPQARFCSVCSHFLLSPHPAPTQACPACNYSNRVGARFCLACGTAMVTRRQVPVQPSPYGTGNLPANKVLRERYVIHGLVAKGGQAAVYRVGDNRLAGKVWALKEMSESAITPAERQQAITAFQREARLLATLDHPNLPKVVDTFEEHGKQYMVMEYVDGRTLAQILESTTDFLPVDRVLDWADQLCDVLSYLHSQDPPIIYRDLKPQNAMEVEGTTTIKVVDFGIARFYSPGKKKDTVNIGTPGYAPPEQYGKGQSDARTDVYALGATLHCLLTRRDPSGDPWRFPPARSLNKAVPRDLDACISRAVSVQRDDRFPSIEAMRQALLGKAKPSASHGSRPASSVKPMLTPVPTSPAVASRSVAVSPAPDPLATPGPISITPGPALPPGLSLPGSPSGPVLSPSRLDFGSVEKGRSSTRSFQVSDGPGLTGKLVVQQPWATVSPATIVHSGQEVEVTVDTAALRLARGGGGWLVADRIGEVRQTASRLAAGGWKEKIELAFLSPVLLVALLVAAVGQGASKLASCHAHRLVPSACTYQGQVRVETDAGEDEIVIDVIVQPRGQDLLLGWASVAAVMLLELAVVGMVGVAVAAALLG